MEVRLTSLGKPLLMVGGRDTASIKRRMGLADSTGTILLVAGGIAAAVLAVSLLSDDSDDRTPNGGSCPIAPPC
jgi:hypothetical protein